MLPNAITLSRDLAEVENSVPWGRMNPLLRVISSLRPTEDLAEDDDDAVDDEDAILLSGGGGENPGLGGVLEGDAIIAKVVDFVRVERGGGTGDRSAEDIGYGEIYNAKLVS
jgi:hypothetical protein